MHLFDNNRIILFSTAAAVMAVSQPAAGQEQARQLRIAAQPLASALQQVARQTGTNILFQPEIVSGREAPALNGRYTAAQAVGRLIGSSDLVVRKDKAGALIISRRERTSLVPATDNRAVDAALSDSSPPADEIVVTASKRTERLVEVPQSISVVTGEQFRKEQSVRFTDYLNKIPGVNLVSFAQGNAQIVFRGLTTGSDQLSSTVGIYVDEVPYGSSTIFTIGATNTPDFDPRDLDRLEVLRGPQGTLYGADSLGGVLKYVTTPPRLNKFEGRIQGGISDIADGGPSYDVNGMLNVPLVEGKLGLRVTGYGRSDAGYVDDDGRGLSDINDSRVYGGRATLLWQPTSDLSIRLSALGQNLKTDNAAIEDIRYDTLQPLYGDLQLRRLINTPIDSKYRLYSGTLNWTLGWAELISATSYSTLNSDSIGDLTFSYGPIFSGAIGVPLGVALDQRIRQNKFTQEIRLQSSSDQTLEWRAGIYYTRENARTEQRLLPFDPATGEIYDPLTNRPGPTDAFFYYRGPSRYSEIAGFGDLTYHFSPAFEVTVGGRYSENRQRFHQVQTGLLLGGQDIDFRRKSKDDSWTYLIDPKLRIAPDAIVYGRVSSGYRPGGPNIGLPAGNGPATFAPDTVVSYEAGIKGDALDRKLSFDVAAFRIDWKDIQVAQSFGGFVYVVNGPRARSQGIEASASIRPLKGLSFSATGTYTDAELRADAPTSVGGFAGERLPNVPRWTGTIDGSYDWRIDEWSPFVGASLRYQGNRKTEFISTPAGPVSDRATLPDYVTLDLRAGISNERWSINLFAKNLTDKRAILGITPLTPIPDPAALSAIPFSAGILQPRTIGASLSASF